MVRNIWRFFVFSALVHLWNSIPSSYEAGREKNGREKREMKKKKKKRKEKKLTVRDRCGHPRAHREGEAPHEVRTGSVRVVERVEVVRGGGRAEVADVLPEGVDGGS